MPCLAMVLLVPPYPSQNLVNCKWVFHIKHKLDGSIERYKAQLVTKGFHQHPSIDYHDTFGLVVKPTTIRVILSLVLSNEWSLQQLDVNNVFLHGHLFEDVYMVQPLGFIDQIFPTICVIFVKLSMVLSKLHKHGTLNCNSFLWLQVLLTPT